MYNCLRHDLQPPPMPPRWRNAWTHSMMLPRPLVIPSSRAIAATAPSAPRWNSSPQVKPRKPSGLLHTNPSETWVLLNTSNRSLFWSSRLWNAPCCRERLCRTRRLWTHHQMLSGRRASMRTNCCPRWCPNSLHRPRFSRVTVNLAASASSRWGLVWKSPHSLTPQPLHKTHHCSDCSILARVSCSHSLWWKAKKKT